MSTSFTVEIPLTCPNCGTSWTLEPWFLVDVSERPDLEQKILDGSIDHFFCPQCNEPALSRFPLILFRPGTDFVLLLSTEEAKPPDNEETRAIGAALGLLQQRLGERFKPEWLAQGMPLVSRELLPEFLRQGHNSVPDQRDPVADMLMRYLRAKSWRMNREILERHPELLDPKLESRIADLGLDADPRFEQELEVLRQCRRSSVKDVFGDLFDDDVLHTIQEAEELLERQSYAEALELLEVASRECDRDVHPRPWAWVHFAVGTCLIAEALLPEPARWERAIAEFQEALTIYTREDDPHYWASTNANLAIVYGHLARSDEQLECIAHALAVFTPEDDIEKWTTLKLSQARIYVERHRGSRSENMELALDSLKEVAQTCGPNRMTQEWQRACANLCGLFRESASGDRADSIERAIHYGELVLKSRTRLPSDVGCALHSNLGAAYGMRVQGDARENACKEIEHLQLALETVDPAANPAAWATVQHNLANSYFRNRGEDHEAMLSRSIEHYRAALSVIPRRTHAIDYAQTLTGLGSALMERREERAGNVREALEIYTEAAEILESSGDFGAACETHANLGIACRELARNGDEAKLADAKAHFNFLVNGEPDRVPAALMERALGALVGIAFDEGDWSEVHRLADHFLSHHRLRLGAAYTEQSRLDLLASATTIYSMDAYASLRLGELPLALSRMEEGKARRMMEAIVAGGSWGSMPPKERSDLGERWAAIRELEEQLRLGPETPGRRPSLELADALKEERSQFNLLLADVADAVSAGSRLHVSPREIVEAIPVNGAIVSLVVTERGSAAVVLPDGITEFCEQNVVWIDGFTRQTLGGLLAAPDGSRKSWFGSYASQSEDFDAWAATIDSTTATLWTELIAPIVERLTQLGVASGAPVLVLSPGSIAMLPLHAAWRVVENERRYLLDDFTVWFAPSVNTYRASCARLVDLDLSEPSLLAVMDSMLDLDFAQLEGQTIAGMFAAGRKQLLAGNEARPRTVIRSAPDKSHIHFACHAFHAWGEPMRSGLVMADNRSLALWEVIARMDLRRTRLVTLSACETGLTDSQYAAEEFLGLSMGFLQAGAPGVIGTFWEVDDLSTMLLMQRFYSLHLSSGFTPAAALRGAQKWLRDLTDEELEEELSQLRPRPASAKRRAKGAPEARALPFAHPYHWAGFALHGC